MAEDAWNSRDPDRVVLAYTEDCAWRNRSVFLNGREELRAFLHGKWQRERDYRLIKSLWTFGDDRIAVRFQYEWHDETGELAPLLRQRTVGVRGRRPHGAPRSEQQRRRHPRRRAPLPLATPGPRPEDVDEIPDVR